MSMKIINNEPLVDQRITRDNDRVVSSFWRGWKQDKRKEVKRVKHREMIKLLKRNKRFRIRQRGKDK